MSYTSFWRENAIAVVNLLPVVARMSWWRTQVIKCLKSYHFAIGKGLTSIKRNNIIPDDAVDRRKLEFQILLFKQQLKASLEQFYLFNYAEGQHEQIIDITVF